MAAAGQPEQPVSHRRKTEATHPSLLFIGIRVDVNVQQLCLDTATGSCHARWMQHATR